MVVDAPAGGELLALLRGRDQVRPPVRPGVAPRLHAALEAAAGPARDLLAPDVTVRVTKGRLRQVLVCERHLVASLREAGPATPEMVRGRILDHLFAQVVMGFPLGADPVDDALDAAGVTADDDLVAEWEALSADDRAELRYTVPAWATDLAGRWPSLPPGALPRLQEPLRVELAGGQVLLSGRVDLVLGRPAGGRVGTTLLDVKSGSRRYEDVQDAGWYALLETIRQQAPPFQTGNYYLREGLLALEVVTDELLVRQADRVAEGIGRLVRLAAGVTPATTPSGICPWCPALPTCAPGRRHAAERGFDPAPVPRRSDGRHPEPGRPDEEQDDDDDDGPA